MINEYGLIDRVVNLNSDKLEDITDYTKADEKINSLKNKKGYIYCIKMYLKMC